MVRRENPRRVDVAKLMNELASRGFYVLGETPPPEPLSPEEQGTDGGASVRPRRPIRAS